MLVPQRRILGKKFDLFYQKNKKMCKNKNKKFIKIKCRPYLGQN